MLQEAKPGYAEDGHADQPEIHSNDQTQYERKEELKLAKAQADMLATELAHEKAILNRFNRHICQQSDECETLELIVSYLMSETSGADSKNIKLQDKRLMLIGGSPAYGEAVKYFVNSMGGKISLLSSNISAGELSQHDEEISTADMVMFQSNTFSEMSLWNAVRNICGKYNTKFTILSKATISCFSNRVSAAF